MKPQWFECQKIPFSQMWPDDVLWFPLMLQKRKFVGYFKFQGHDVILSHKLEEVKELWQFWVELHTAFQTSPLNAEVILMYGLVFVIRFHWWEETQDTVFNSVILFFRISDLTHFSKDKIFTISTVISLLGFLICVFDAFYFQKPTFHTVSFLVK